MQAEPEPQSIGTVTEGRFCGIIKELFTSRKET